MKAGLSGESICLQSHFSDFTVQISGKLVLPICLDIGWTSEYLTPEFNHQTSLPPWLTGGGWKKSDCSGIVLGQLFQFFLLLLSVLSGNNQGVRVAHHHLQNRHSHTQAFSKGLLCTFICKSSTCSDQEQTALLPSRGKQQYQVS